MKDVGLLIARLIAGSLVAGHGAQKLFGWFEGPGWEKWTGMTESMMGMRPGRFWGGMQAVGEFGGGVLAALGLMNPIGPIAIVGTMLAASYKGHWGKPIWASKGGAELSVSFLATAVVVGSQSPGRYSLDSLLGVRLPRWLTAVTVLGTVALLAETVRPTLTPRLFPAPEAPEPVQPPEQ
ncbi:DoxX family protein [Candidatus Nephthysia bennettiae]|uniref:DoxX family protein n=1 Tax=Candidatus Nephthysia bennettiae TaxID=3127016 RepID=A0A934JZ32_9BACT|nr:DoxX family protein [Candidatus Dormibacteraeota bacterium]